MTHLPHIEELVLEGRAEEALALLSSFHLAKVTTKWDGAPAIFIGKRNGEFFVSLKAVFNNEPVFFVSEDAIQGTPVDESLRLMFREFSASDLPEETILHGDLLYEILHEIEVAGESYLALHPNTIVYAIPSASKDAEIIRRSKLGVVWHTVYRGPNIEASPADIRDTPFTTEMIRSYCPQLLVPPPTFTHIKPVAGVPSGILVHLKRYLNIAVKHGKTVTWCQAASAVRKCYTTHQKQLEVTRAITPELFACYDAVVRVKQDILEDLERQSQVKTFLKHTDGTYTPTSHEGYVATFGSTRVKLVDRTEFSRANFDPNIVKGWDRGR